MRGDWWREQSDIYAKEVKALEGMAASAEEWEAVALLRTVSSNLFSIGGALDLHDEKYQTKETTS